MPFKSQHVMKIVLLLHGGKDYEPRFGQRMCGTGAYVQALAQRFNLTCKRLGLNRHRCELTCSLCKSSQSSGFQLELF